MRSTSHSACHRKAVRGSNFFIFLIKGNVKGLYCHSYMLCLFDHLCFLASALMGNQENEDKISGACVNYRKRICSVKVALNKFKIWIHFEEAVQSYKACFHKIILITSSIRYLESNQTFGFK